MRVKLVAANGESYTLPEGFMMAEIPEANSGASVLNVLGRDGGAIDLSSTSLSSRELEIKGRIMDPDELEAGDLQGARATAVSQYFAIMAFCGRTRMLGPIRIYREADIIIDPLAEGYDAELEPLGYYLNGYFKGGTTASLFGANAGGGVVDMTLRFIIARPLWQGMTYTARTTGNAGGGQSVSLTFTNSGTADCRPVFIIKPSAQWVLGPTEEVVLTVDGVATVSWSGTIGANVALVFDTASKQVYSLTGLPADDVLPAWSKGAATNQASGLVDMTGWSSLNWDFATGDHTLAVTSDAVSAQALTVEVRHTNEYFG